MKRAIMRIGRISESSCLLLFLCCQMVYRQELIVASRISKRSEVPVFASHQLIQLNSGQGSPTHPPTVSMTILLLGQAKNSCSKFSTAPPHMEQTYDRTMKIWTSKGEEQEVAKKEVIEHLKVLEQQLGDKPYFGGDTFGYVDVLLIPFYSWFYILETEGNFKIEESNPKIIDWAKRCLQRESVAKTLPDQKKLYEFVQEYKKKLGVE